MMQTHICSHSKKHLYLPYTYIHIDICKHGGTHTHMHPVHICAHTEYTFMCIHAHTHPVHIYAHTHAHTVHIHAYTVNIHVHTCTHVPSTHLYTHMHIHTVHIHAHVDVHACPFSKSMLHRLVSMHTYLPYCIKFKMPSV